MAVTITKSKRGPEYLGTRKVVPADIVLDNSYPTGGYALTPAMFGGRKIESVEVIGANPAGGRMSYYWDPANLKLMVFYPTGGAAVPAALADPSVAVPAGGTAVTSTAAQPNLTETAGRGVEVANATDLSTITVKVRVTML